MKKKTTKHHLDNVFCITAILKLSKPKTLLRQDHSVLKRPSCPFVVLYLDRDVPYSSIALEELLNVPVMKIRLESWMKMFPI